MNSKAGLGAAALALGLITYLYLGERQRAATLRSELSQLRAEKDALGAKAERLEGAQMDASELDRLRAEQREAIRLRGELTNLKQQLAGAEASAKTARSAADAAQARAEKAQAAASEASALAVPQVFNFRSRAMLAPGQNLVVGGWVTKPGVRTYAFLSPTIAQQGADSLMVSGKLVEIPEALAQPLQSIHGLTDGGLTLAGEDLEAMLAGWEQQPGFKVISSPRVIVQSGKTGSVSVGAMKPTADGMKHFGSEIEVTPTLAPDGGNIQLNVNANLTVDGKNE